MSGRVAAAGRELQGLFVDDGALSAGVLAWLVLMAALLRVTPVPDWARGALLFAGLVGALAWSVLRAAGGPRR